MVETSQASEEKLLADVGRRLISEFPQVSPEAVDALIRREHSRFDSSRIRDFVPLLVERHAREHLKYGTN